MVQIQMEIGFPDFGPGYPTVDNLDFIFIFWFEENKKKHNCTTLICHCIDTMDESTTFFFNFFTKRINPIFCDINCIDTMISIFRKYLLFLI